MKKQRSPTSVTPRSSSVPVFMVTCFADVAVGADHEPGRAAAILDRLRRRAERGERIDHGARADGGVAGDVDVGDQPAAVADRHVRADDAIGTDRDVAPDHRRRPRSGRRGIDRRSLLIGPRIMAPTSASATIWPRDLGLAAEPPHGLAVRRSWSCGIRSCRRARTGLRNLALSMVRKKTWLRRASPHGRRCTARPPVCAMPSIISTPGNTGLSGEMAHGTAAR